MIVKMMPTLHECYHFVCHDASMVSFNPGTSDTIVHELDSFSLMWTKNSAEEGINYDCNLLARQIGLQFLVFRLFRRKEENQSSLGLWIMERLSTSRSANSKTPTVTSSSVSLDGDFKWFVQQGSKILKEISYPFLYALSISRT